MAGCSFKKRCNLISAKIHLDIHNNIIYYIQYNEFDQARWLSIALKHYQHFNTKIFFVKHLFANLLMMDSSLKSTED